ncbi:hypothetical protein THASP1DRAFT_26015 [Thamnocephalis sphaerospora]|uniref:Swi5-domain-containing protein n=1 Tax=Thamnocephalis sphaerospora TaxID=78915 RepID=A0A4P9XIH1_9FUNG|nr:hypothetical protein THASP1DRAFT_26015 [Thamnocephalis sphaerospora]|eukprot:RKP05496.1 hypothetical protein THASP1DRAFT_26015 [Thamnocephalis sphaerospora]
MTTSSKVMNAQPTELKQIRQLFVSGPDGAAGYAGEPYTLADICETVAMQPSEVQSMLETLQHDGTIVKLMVHGTDEALAVYVASPLASAESKAGSSAKTAVGDVNAEQCGSMTISPSTCITSAQTANAAPTPALTSTRDVNAALRGIVAALERKRDALRVKVPMDRRWPADAQAAELDAFMAQLHDYNELKDMGQMLLGKLAELQGCTIKEMHDQFDLHDQDLA